MSTSALGGERLPTLGVSALALRPAETFAPRRRSASAVFHVIEGNGDATVDDVETAGAEADTIAVPTPRQCSNPQQFFENGLFVHDRRRADAA